MNNIRLWSQDSRLHSSSLRWSTEGRSCLPDCAEGYLWCCRNPCSWVRSRWTDKANLCPAERRLVFDALLSKTIGVPIREIAEQICCFWDVFFRFHSHHAQSASHPEKDNYDRSGVLPGSIWSLGHSTPVGRWLQQVAMASVLSSRSTFQSVLIVGSTIHLVGNNRDQADMPLLVRYIDFDMKSQN